ncbi:MAG: IS1595 family transposase [Opitutales bacterium]|nr:IS1595 family transposase [Opitutales bacterium]
MRRCKLSPQTQQMLLRCFAANMSGREAGRFCGVNYKTALLFFRKLRAVIKAERDLKATGFDGSNAVAIDECYIKGNWDGGRVAKTVKRGRGTLGKFVVGGIVSREGGHLKRVKFEELSGISAVKLLAFAKQHIEPGATVWTDEFRGYNKLRTVYEHRRCCHAREEWVGKTGATTAGCEVAFRFLRKYLRTYMSGYRYNFKMFLAECEWRVETKVANAFPALLDLCERARAGFFVAA